MQTYLIQNTFSLCNVPRIRKILVLLKFISVLIVLCEFIYFNEFALNLINLLKIY